jgi:glycosyltransferase involved in cell wall biosynthesis
VVTHTSPALVQALHDHAERRPVDLWHCEWTPYAQAVRGLRGAPRLVMAHNVESVIWQRYYETERNPLKWWYIGRQWKKYRAFEREIAGEMDQVVAVSDVDAQRLRDDFGAGRVDVVENGVDTTYFRPTAARRLPGRLLFLGSLDWRPNLDGVTQMLDVVFPAVRAAEPGASLRLVGRNPPAWLRRRVAATPGVELFADVPDVRPFLAECSAMVVPLRVGGGSRLKILEALATATPVVSTAVGAEGLHLEPGRHLTVSAGIADLAGAIYAALRYPEGAQRQAERGREAVLRRYDWDVLADQLERVWLDCSAAPKR